MLILVKSSSKNMRSLSLLTYLGRTMGRNLYRFSPPHCVSRSTCLRPDRVEVTNERLVLQRTLGLRSIDHVEYVTAAAALANRKGRLRRARFLCMILYLRSTLSKNSVQ